MVKIKQVEGLSNLEQVALVSVTQAADGTVTFTRGDGTTFSFLTDDGVSGRKGDKGPKGDRGPDGLGAYEIAVAGGYAGTETQWRASLKGETGDKGKDAVDGVTGTAGITPTFNTSISVIGTGIGNNPTVEKNTVVEDETTKTYSLSLGIPQGKNGIPGISGTKYTISTMGVITKTNSRNAATASANITWDNNIGTINIALPTGAAGEKGNDITGETGYTPTLASVTKGSELAAGSVKWLCTRNGTPAGGAINYTIQLGQAAKGEKGPTGYKGEDGINVSIAKAYKDTNTNYWPFGRKTELARLNDATGYTPTTEWGIGHSYDSNSGDMSVGWYVGRRAINSNVTSSTGRVTCPYCFALIHTRNYGAGCCHTDTFTTNNSTKWTDMFLLNDKIYDYYEGTAQNVKWVNYVHSNWKYSKANLTGPT